MSLPYLFDKRLVVRTPSLPLPEQLHTIDHDSLLKNDFFLEALYLASPVLYKECIKWKEGAIPDKKDQEKLTRSLSKYFLRMSSRCTPFGLFSGCAVAAWQPGAGAPIVDRDKRLTHTRLDMHYLCALSMHLSERPDIRRRLFFSPNNSLYQIGNELRYIEYSLAEGSRSYRVSSVTASEYLEKIVRFADSGTTISQIVHFLEREEIDTDEAAAFVDELIASQILVSEMQPAITGHEFMEQLISVLERLSGQDTPSVDAVLTALREVRQLLKKIDDNVDKTGIGHHRDIMQILEGLGVPYDEGKLFQTDTVKTLSASHVDTALQHRILEALWLLNRLALPRGNEPLKAFARDFARRYEDKEMPLMEVLDPEIGIGYEQSAAGCMAPLVEGIQLQQENNTEQKLAWSKLEDFLSKKLEDALKTDAQLIELREEELGGFSAGTDDLPPSFPVMFRIMDRDKIYIENAGGSSAVNLLGRFAHADPAIRDLALDITSHEQQQDPGVVFAEIVHLPESRTGNILLHPAFRDYEIPYLAQTSVAEEFRIDINDLYVSVKQKTVLLRSKRLNKLVIPRLSTAHNYVNNTLPVYRFLCDLQTQNKKSVLTFHWGSLQQHHKYLPRVMYKNTVLHLARWRFTKEDIEPLRTGTGDIPAGKLDDFKKKWKLPAYVMLSEGDNELLLDLESRQSIGLWLDAVKNKDSFILREFIRPDTVRDGQGALYSNQFLAILMKNGPSYGGIAAIPPAEVSRGSVTREFSLGSEWVYFKLYCGTKSADRILLEAIGPIARELSARDLIHKWFFIRYQDPEFHLRLRFELKDTQQLGTLIGIVHACLKAFQDQRYIWRIQTDTYQREIERYGSNTIALAESLFCFDSIACLQMLLNTAGDHRETIRWIWSLKAVDELLNCFELDPEQKLDLMQDLRNAFGIEFNVDKIVKNQLNDKYRINRNIIDSVMKGEPGLPEEWQPLLNVLEEKTRQISPVAATIVALYRGGKLETSFPGLLASYIHMMLNRIIPTSPRTHELVIYDFLSRYYKTQIVLKKNQPATEKPGQTAEKELIAGFVPHKH